MAADADAPNGELSEKAAKAPSPPSSDRTDDGSPVSPDESEPTTAGRRPRMATSARTTVVPKKAPKTVRRSSHGCRI